MAVIVPRAGEVAANLRIDALDPKAICEELNRNNCKISEPQVKKLLDVAARFLTSPEEFCNLKKDLFSEGEVDNLNPFKIHIFKKEPSHVRIYVDEKKSRKKGGYKIFSRVHSIDLTANNESKAHVSEKAKLSLNFINLYRRGKTASANAYAGFKKEIDLLNQLKGRPHIVQIEDSQKYIGSLKFKREEGGFIKEDVEKVVMYQSLYTCDLAELLKTERDKLTASRTKTIFEGCFKGLNELEEAGIKHSDLKPTNIFIDKDDQPAIGDFGFASKAGEPPHAGGTAAYFSPEKFYNYTKRAGLTLAIGPASDVWSMGCSLATLVNPTPPIWVELQNISKRLKHFYDSVRLIPNTYRLQRKVSYSKNPHLKNLDGKFIIAKANFSAFYKYLNLLKENINVLKNFSADWSNVSSELYENFNKISPLYDLIERVCGK